MIRRALFATTLAVAFLAMPRLATAASATLSYSNFFPPSHVQSKLAEEWCKEVEKRTGGEVVVNYFPGQTLTKADQAYDGVVNGISDIALSLFAYTRGRFPVMQAVDLPLGYPNAKVATAALNGVYTQLKPKELEDVKVLYLHAHGPGLIFTKARAVKTMEDMKGLKFRATGASADMIKALGGTPVAMPMPDTYQSLQTGVVDGAAFPVESAKGWKLAEVTKFMIESYPVAYTSSFFIVMNKDKWNALSPKAQKAIEELNTEWTAKTAAAWDEIDGVGMALFKEKGGTVTALSAEEADKWKKAVAPVMENYVQEMAKKGLDGKKALDVAQTVLAGKAK